MHICIHVPLFTCILPFATAHRAQLGEPISEDDALVQVVVTRKNRLLVSVCEPRTAHALRNCLSRFPAGAVVVPRYERCVYATSRPVAVTLPKPPLCISAYRQRESAADTPLS